jgi:formylglycine-generating enzyme required for sulfatase activity
MKRKSGVGLTIFILCLLGAVNIVLIQSDVRAQSEEPIPSTYKDTVTGMEFVWVEGGCYSMGDNFGDGSFDEKPVHQVCVDGFYIGKYEVTQGQWHEIMRYNPSMFKKGDRNPVEQVSWDDTQEFIKKLNLLHRMHFSLPTEAQWEYACRSMEIEEKNCGGNDANSVAWNKSNSMGMTHQVGTKSPNGFEIYDMSGNVEEWVIDWYDSHYYGKSSRNNPQGPPSGALHVIRGGSWSHNPMDVRAAARNWYSPGVRIAYVGFRLVSQGQ